MNTLIPPTMSQMTSASSSQPVVTSQNPSSLIPSTGSLYQDLFDAARLYLQQSKPPIVRTPLATIVPASRKRATPPSSPTKQRPDKEQRIQGNSSNSDEITSFSIRYKPFSSLTTVEWIVTEKMLRQMGAGSADIERMAVDSSHKNWIASYLAIANRFLSNTALVEQEAILTATIKGADSYLRLVNEHLKKKTTYLSSKSMFAKGPDGQKRPVHPLMGTIEAMTNAQLKRLFLEAANCLATSRSSLIPFSFRLKERDIHILSYLQYGKTSLMLWSGVHASEMMPSQYFLGQGGFSIAQKVIAFANGTCHALRASRCDTTTKRQAHAIDDLKREKDLLHYLNASLGPVDGLPESPSHFWIAEETLQYGMLDSIYEGDLSKVEFRSIQPATRKIQFLRQMAKIIDVVKVINHVTFVAHGDLKQRNILYRILLPNEEFDLRLTDFGHSRDYSDILHREDNFPALYTEGYFIKTEHQALYSRASRYQEDAVAETLRRMEVFALGITLQKILRPYYDQTPKALRDCATSEGLNKDFYMNLKKLVSRMTVKNPRNRLPLEQAAPALNAILDEALPSKPLSPTVSNI